MKARLLPMHANDQKLLLILIHQIIQIAVILHGRGSNAIELLFTDDILPITLRDSDHIVGIIVNF